MDSNFISNDTGPYWFGDVPKWTDFLPNLLPDFWAMICSTPSPAKKIHVPYTHAPNYSTSDCHVVLPLEYGSGTWVPHFWV